MSGLTVSSAQTCSTPLKTGTDSAQLYQEGSFAAMVPAESVSRIAAFAQGTSKTQSFTGVDQVIYNGLCNNMRTIDISSYNLTQDQLKSHIQLVVNTCPELFYVSGNYSFSYSSSSSRTVANYMPNYSMSGTELTEAKQFYQTQMNRILSHINPSWSDLEKVLYAHDYLAQNFEYDTSYTVRDAYNFFYYGKGVCQAYTLVFSGIMRALGIEVSVASSESMNHIWNVVRVNGKWYHVDATWDDPLPDKYGLAYHNYVLLSDTAMQTYRGGSSQNHHSWTCSYTCSDMTYDSYFWEDSTSPFQYLDDSWYFTSYDSTDKTGSLYAYSFDTQEAEAVYSFGKWYQSKGSSSYYYGCFSGLSAYNDTLFFNSSDTIYSYTPSDDTLTAVHEPDISSAIYGMRTESGKLCYNVSSSPSNTGTIYYIELDEEEKLPYETTLPSQAPSEEPSPSPTAAASNPPVVSSQNPAVTSSPDVSSSQNPAVTSSPDVGASQNPAVTSSPDAGASQNPAVTASPDAGASQNPAVTPSPDTGASPSPGTQVKGDVDQDGFLTLSDAQLALKIALKITTADSEQYTIANVDGDSSVTLSDAQLILKAALKIITL